MSRRTWGSLQSISFMSISDASSNGTLRHGSGGAEWELQIINQHDAPARHTLIQLRTALGRHCHVLILSFGAPRHRRFFPHAHERPRFAKPSAFFGHFPGVFLLTFQVLI